MEITIDFTKDLKKNAADYFEKAKKAKKKIVGAKKMIEQSKDKLEQLRKKQKELLEKQQKELNQLSQKKEKIKKEWYENFRWFISSEGFLCIGGRDATTNDIIIKKHTDPDDIVFHTEMPGSPFFVIKIIKGKPLPTEITLREVAQATAAFSKSWKLGMTTAEVYGVKASQVKKKFGLPKGSFMIEGKREYFSPRLSITIGITKDHRIMAGPFDAVKKQCIDYVQIVQGDEKASDLAKKIKQKINADLDDIIRVIPAGGAQLKK